MASASRFLGARYPSLACFAETLPQSVVWPNADVRRAIAPATGVASGGHDLGLGMLAGTSPGIGLDPGLGGARPQTWQIVGPGNNRLNGRSRNDLIYGARGNDLIYGSRVTTSSTAARAMTASTARPATIGSSTTAAPRPCSRDREPTGSTSPTVGTTIGWRARPVRLTRSAPTRAIGSREAAEASGRPSATYASSSARHELRRTRPPHPAHATVPDSPSWGRLDVARGGSGGFRFDRGWTMTNSV